ncbi:MAG: TlpA disulfide reductase family protein [Bacteroidales bacterium]|nr:TlpA disulfide reductase family protein [Bacteroidales bacterium]
MKSFKLCIILAITIFIGACTGNTDNKTVSITGKIDGLVFKGKYEKQKDTIFFSYNNINGERSRDTILVVDGQLLFKKELEIVGLTRGRIFMPMDTVTKWVVNGYYPTAVSRIDFLMYPGAKLNIEGSIKDYVDAYAFDGGVNDKLAELAKLTHILENEAVNAQVKIGLSSYFHSSRFADLSEEEILAKEEEKGIVRLTDVEAEELASKIEVLNMQSQELKIQFIKDNPDSDAAPYILEGISRGLEYEDYKALYKGLSEKAKTNSFGSVIATKLAAIEGTKIGNPAPAISGTTVNDKEFKLEQLKGKVVLIDFWGTWCGPCMQGMPKLKELNELYKDDLAIVGIASDQEASWRKGIEEHKLNWIHLLDAKGDIALNNYNITGFPTKFLIDREGVIRFKEIGENEESELEEVLETLLIKQ